VTHTAKLSWMHVAIGVALVAGVAAFSVPASPGTRSTGETTTRGPRRPHLAPYVEVPVRAWRVIDADTIEVTVIVSAPVRLSGVDAPELRNADQRPAAEVAKRATIRWIDQAVADGHRLRARIYHLGPFSRLEGELVNASGQRLSDHLLASGVAVPSEDKRHHWTAAELERIERRAEQ